MKHKLLLLGLLLNSIVISFTSPIQAYVGLCCAHCGGNMPMNIPGGGIPETHEFRFKLTQNFMEMGPMRDGNDDLDLVGDLLGSPAAGKFAAVPRGMQMHMTMIGAAYSFTDDFALMAMTGYKRNDMQMAFNESLKASSGAAGFTMQSDGMTDVRVMGKYRLHYDDKLAPKRQVTAMLGISFPTGEIDSLFKNNPITVQNGSIHPFKMQQGTGTFDPVFGLLYQGSKDPFWYGINAIYWARVMDNDQGYHKGDEFNLDFYGMYQFHEKAIFELQLNGYNEERYSDEPNLQRLNGHGHVGFNPSAPFISPLFDPDNYGGTKLNISGGFQFQPFPLHIVEIQGSTPIYQNLRGPQLREDYRIMFTYYIEIPTSKSRRYLGTKPPKELGF